MRAVLVLLSASFACFLGVETADAAPPPVASSTLSPWLAAAAKNRLEPLDLYAVALQESRRFFSDGQLRPWPWTLHTPQEGALYFNNYESAAAKLKELLSAGVRNIDIGMMQVNWGWHQHRVQDATELLHPARNIEIAAQILREHLDEHGGDLRQAFARYHNARAEYGEPYAAAVLAILEQLRGLREVASALVN